MGSGLHQLKQHHWIAKGVRVQRRVNSKDSLRIGKIFTFIGFGKGYVFYDNFGENFDEGLKRRGGRRRSPRRASREIIGAGWTLLMVGE